MELLENKFESVFGKEYDYAFFAPGRINLIGEHIDYSGGNVFPCAITNGTYALVRIRDDHKFRFVSLNVSDTEILEIDASDLAYDENHGWVNYAKGIIATIAQKGLSIDTGFEVLYYGDIPNGAGLSSSASLGIVTAEFIRKINQLPLSDLDLVVVTKDSENQYIGVNTGIMDQFTVMFGQKDTALRLNTETLDYDRVPVQLEGHKIVIMNTNKQRALADSKYNERLEECARALSIIQKHYDVSELCQLNREQLEAIVDAFRDDMVAYRRARHAISENDRVHRAVRKLRHGELLAFGKLLNASHKSLKDDYEVTGKELDTIVEAAWDEASCIGARVTGAGFGGCAIAIVTTDAIPTFIKNVGNKYKEVIGYEANFYVAEIGDGSHEIKR